MAQQTTVRFIDDLDGSGLDFSFGATGGALNYILVILIMVGLFMGRVVVRLSRRRAGFHAPAGALS